jgi:hypothetical protein
MDEFTMAIALDPELLIAENERTDQMLQLLERFLRPRSAPAAAPPAMAATPREPERTASDSWE